MASARPGPVWRASAWKVDGALSHRAEEAVATEEPMEVRLVSGGRRYPVAVTMRTPGSDFELAVGFLHNEGVLRDPARLRRVSYCVDRDVAEEQRYNIVNVEVAGPIAPEEITPLERHFSMTSACGVCGRASLDALFDRGYARLCDGPTVERTVIDGLADRLRRSQPLFDATGGLHAAGLFTADGELVAVREDVGRHNALDKLSGWALMQGMLPLAGHIVMVSGRSSFELVQKTIAIGAGVLCSVSAPSSLAVQLANELNLTLVGFLRGERFNVYAGAGRLSLGQEFTFSKQPGNGGDMRRL